MIQCRLHFQILNCLVFHIEVDDQVKMNDLLLLSRDDVGSNEVHLEKIHFPKTNKITFQLIVVQFV